MAYGPDDPRNARVVIDACKPFNRRDSFPLVVRPSKELDERIRKNSRCPAEGHLTEKPPPANDRECRHHADHQRRDHAIRVEPRKTLVDAIRDDCGQTGTHIGCEHGVCGSCTLIIDDDAVRSCLMFAVQAQGRNIRTVEGLAEGDISIHCNAPSSHTMACNAASARPDFSCWR